MQKGVAWKISFLLIIVIWFCLFTHACERSQTEDEPLPKNVLLISIDDLGPMLGTYGQKHMHTPAMDRLAEAGLQFNRAYVQMAW